MSMSRTYLVAVLMLGAAAPALADVTIRQMTGGKGLGVSGNAPATIYIKGHRMRTDTVVGDRTQTMVFDVDAQRLYMFDSRRKEADVWDMAAFAQQVSQAVDAGSMRASIKPNGQTKQIGGQAAAGHDVEISMQSALGGSKDMMMTVTLSGPVWIVKGAPGASDYAQFYRAAAEKGFIFSDPRAAQGQPGQARAMAELHRQMADIGGIAYETQMQIKMGGGGGPMSGLMARLGNITFTSLVESVTTGPLPDDLFAPPAGYRLNQRK